MQSTILMTLLLLACASPAPDPDAPQRAWPDPADTVGVADASGLPVSPVVATARPPLYVPPAWTAPPPVPIACPAAVTVPSDPYDASAVPVAADAHAEVYGAAEPPRHLRVQWVGDPSTALAVVWRTDSETLSSVVQVGTDAGGFATIYGASFPLSPEPEDGRVHEVRICGLLPGTEYVWRVGGAGHWSADQRATTAPPPGSAGPFRFAVAGDSRDGYDTWAAVLAGIAAEGVSFRMLTGDAVARGDDVAQWGEWLDAGVGFEEVVPTVMINGNHESLAFPFLALNALPGNERTFSFDYANAHFIVLNDTVVSSEEWSTQSVWLAADLAATTQPWRFVFHHKPAFTDASHPPDANVRAWFVPVEEAGGVAIDFAGHNHNYERSVPIMGGVEAPPEAGVTYVVSAGAGAPLYENYGPSATMAVGVSVNHYVVVAVDGSQLELTATDLAGNVIDRYTMTR